MPLNLASLVQTASGAFANRDRRRREEEERARQAEDRAQGRETQILQRSLLEAQIEKLRRPESPPSVSYQPVTDPVTGAVSGYNPRANTLTPSGGRIGVKPPAAAQEGQLLRQKARAGASTAVESIDDAEQLLRRDANADVLPLGAALARGARTEGGLIGAIAGAAEPLAQRSMTPAQQQFQADMQRMVHSMVGLLPGSRQSIVLFNSLVNAYTPQPGESAQTRTAKRDARQRARAWLSAVAAGRPVPVPPELAAAGITEADISGDGESLDSSPEAPQAPSAATPGYVPRFWNPNVRRP